MGNTRRDFLRQTACALGGIAIASSVESFGLVNALAQDMTATDYRALVCVFLSGGNDSDNMIVPLDGEFSNYFNARNPAGLAHQQAALRSVNAPSLGRPFGFHPNMPEMQGLYNQNKVAVLCNVGPLVEPITRQTYQNGTGKRPLQLFSHSDQVNLWQTSIANSVSQTGWGGRVADKTGVLNGAATFPQVVSIAGISVFVTGLNARPLAISDSNTALSSVLPLTMTGSASEVSSRRASFDQIRARDVSPILVRAASDTRTSSLQTSAALASAPPREFAQLPNTTLGRQLEQVARLIALRDTLGVKRQIFFCQVGSFDTHSNQRLNGGGQDGLLLQVSQAMKGFYDATVELGVQDSVTTFTLSDFGRTFQPSGSGAGVGTDHGWGAHHLVMGGAVRGGDFYGRFPTLALGGPDDTDTRGRWIPTTSVEQYAATLATWYGLSTADVPAVFPLIGRFATPNLGFML